MTAIGIGFERQKLPRTVTENIPLRHPNLGHAVTINVVCQRAVPSISRYLRCWARNLFISNIVARSLPKMR
jgi:hypothetical protein